MSGVFDVSHSDIEGGSRGTGNIDADPLFVKSAGDDYLLSAGSPCIDSGTNAAVPEDVMTDLDGHERFVDDPESPDCPQPGADCGAPPITDMGAYEFQGKIVTINIVSSHPLEVELYR